MTCRAPQSRSPRNADAAPLFLAGPGAVSLRRLEEPPKHTAAGMTGGDGGPALVVLLGCSPNCRALVRAWRSLPAHLLR